MEARREAETIGIGAGRRQRTVGEGETQWSPAEGEPQMTREDFEREQLCQALARHARWGRPEYTEADIVPGRQREAQLIREAEHVAMLRYLRRQAEAWEKWNSAKRAGGKTPHVATVD